MSDIDAPQMVDYVIAADDHDPEVWEQVAENRLGKRRWGTDVEYVLKRKADDTFWSFTVYEPATECQEWSEDLVTGVQVVPVTVIKTEYQLVVE